MVLEPVKQRYKNQTIGPEFKRLSDPATEEEATHPIGRDRIKAATWKGNEKERSSSQSESSSAADSIMFTLKKLSISFTKAQLWKQA
jgi:hypothetical protein